jgi:hypothetical protein
MCVCSKLATDGRKIDPLDIRLFFLVVGFGLTQFVMTGKDRQSGHPPATLPPPHKQQIGTPRIRVVC